MRKENEEQNELFNVKIFKNSIKKPIKFSKRLDGGNVLYYVIKLASDFSIISLMN